MGKSLDSKYVEDFAETHFSRSALFDAVLLLHALQIWGPSVSREVTKLLLTVVRVSKLPEKSEYS